MARIAGQLEPVAARASRGENIADQAGLASTWGAVASLSMAEILGQFNALAAFFTDFFLTPSVTALQLRVCLVRE